MPAGVLDTLPVPVPFLFTVSVRGMSVKVAVTVVSLVSVTMHVPVPEQPAPDQPVNVDPAAEVAVSVTCVPLANPAEHVAPQLIPAGELDTLPVPLPPLLTVSCGCAEVLNVAVTVVSAFKVTMRVRGREQPPPASRRTPNRRPASRRASRTCRRRTAWCTPHRS